MDKLLDEALKYYKELQDDSPDNLALPKFHKAMQALIDRKKDDVNVEAIVSEIEESVNKLEKHIMRFLEDKQYYDNIGRSIILPDDAELFSTRLSILIRQQIYKLITL